MPIEHFVYNIRSLERIGVSACIIEDKTGLKKNSNPHGIKLMRLSVFKHLCLFCNNPCQSAMCFNRSYCFFHTKQLLKSSVIPQDTLSYKKNLEELKPDYLVHGDNWKEGFQSSVRAEAIEVLASYGGILKEFPYSGDQINCTHFMPPLVI